MERGLYIAATGMLSATVRQDTIASNLSNVNTAGYKADRVVNETFSSLFLQNLRNGQQVGPMNFGTRVAGVVTDFSQGALRNTGTMTDLAIGGDGFFVVRTPAGETRYTRDGQFTRDANGFLTTQRGDYVLSSLGQPINIGRGDPTVTSDGRVFDSGGTLVGLLGFVTLDMDSNQTRKVGDNAWVGPIRTTGLPAGSSVRQGFVEASGVNSVKEMIEMISTLRSYESSQRAVTAIDGTLDKAVNSVGVVS